MKAKKRTELQLRLEKEARTAEACARALARAKAEEKNTSGSKRKGAADLQEYLSIDIHDARVVRPAADFTTKTYSLERQVVELIKHLFVRYRVPEFLFWHVLSARGRELVFRVDRSTAARLDKKSIMVWERKLFFAYAQGGSTAKILAPQLTKKEAHVFGLAPVNLRATDCLVWAKFVHAGIEPRLADVLMSRIVAPGHLKGIGDRLDDLVRFYAKEGKSMTLGTCREITDFVVAMIEDVSFSFKGRTLGSMLKLSQKWHRANAWGTHSRYSNWAQTYPVWELEHLGERVRATEITNSRDLHDESRRQLHCVFLYLWECTNRQSRIVSFTWLEFGPDGQQFVVRRLTAEISIGLNRVVQVRGKANRRPEPTEMEFVRRWAAHHSVQVADYAAG